MAINPLQFSRPEEYRTPGVDFGTPLSEIGQAIADARKQKLLSQAVASATGPDGKIDANAIGVSLAKLGMTKEAMPFVQMGQTTQFHNDTLGMQGKQLEATIAHQRATEGQAAAALEESRRVRTLDLAKPFKAGEDYFGQPTYLARDERGDYVRVKIPDQPQAGATPQPLGQVPAAPQYPPAPQPNAPLPPPGPQASTFQDRFSPPTMPASAVSSPQDAAAAFLASRPANAQNLIKGIANYEIDPRTALARLPATARANILSDVATYRPDWNQQNYPASQAALTKFTSGKEAATVRAFNVGLEHIDQLMELGKALDNGDIRVINSLRNRFKTEFGADAPTNFNGLKAIVGAEIVKAIVGAGGTGEERALAAKTVADASSPQQLYGIAETYKNAMGAQLGGLQRTYETGTFRKDFQKFLSPAAQKAFESHNKELDKSPQTSAGPVDWRTYFGAR